MIAHAEILDTMQTAAVDAPSDAYVAITGAAGSGKTTALVARARHVARSSHARGTTLVLAPSDAGVARLRTHLAGDEPALRVASFGELAYEILDAEALATNGAPIERIDDIRAAQHFERAGAEIFALEWTEFAAEVDPEITGLRAPERFCAAAFRLIRKLRASLLSPAEFRACGLRGATAFYANPPNFAGADLIMDTPAKYRDSLRVNPAELARQHAREVDLVKILARLYALYTDALATSRCLTPTDAVYDATMVLRARSARGEQVAATYAYALVDDAQDVTLGQSALLEAIFGTALGGVTFAGDAAQATRGFATGARGADAFARATTVIDLTARYRSAGAIEAAARCALAAGGTLQRDDSVVYYRADSVRDEARFVVAEVESLLRAGTPPERIAVVVRNLSCAQTYVDALLARDVPVDVAGAASIYEFPAVLDALGALWAAVDPYRHDYLLRTLEAPWMRLCDASIATLCADATDPQPLLFELADDVKETTERRWDRRRSLRLGRNVTRGDVDADLPAAARERLAAFREARERWEAASRQLDPAALARLILDDTVLATVRAGARGRFEGALVARLLDAIDDVVTRDSFATLEDALVYLERVASGESDLLAIVPRDSRAVRVLDVEAAKGETFDAVFIVDVRAGAFPRYYVPDAFLFTPTVGMIPKDNVGDAGAARTAKFTYTLFRYKFREKYIAEERRAFACAATRARERLFVSASGSPTRGVSAPEILAELMRL
jgi:superfamily I DNA/RNA helicase